MITVFVTLTLSDSFRWPELAAKATALGAEAAVLQGEGPGLVAQLDALAKLGATRIHLVGVTFGDDLGPASWLGRVARWWLNTRGSATQLWCPARPLRAMPTMLPDTGASQLLGPRDTLTHPDWEDPPPVDHQVLVCRGPRCTAKGAAQVHDQLSRALDEAGALDVTVLLTNTGCVFPCNRAPVIVVQPEMSWRGPMSPVGISEVVAELTARQPALATPPDRSSR